MAAITGALYKRRCIVWLSVRVTIDVCQVLNDEIAMVEKKTRRMQIHHQYAVVCLRISPHSEFISRKKRTQYNKLFRREKRKKYLCIEKRGISCYYSAYCFFFLLSGFSRSSAHIWLLMRVFRFGSFKTSSTRPCVVSSEQITKTTARDWCFISIIFNSFPFYFDSVSSWIGFVIRCDSNKWNGCQRSFAPLDWFVWGEVFNNQTNKKHGIVYMVVVRLIFILRLRASMDFSFHSASN